MIWSRARAITSITLAVVEWGIIIMNLALLGLTVKALQPEAIVYVPHRYGQCKLRAIEDIMPAAA